VKSFLDLQEDLRQWFDPKHPKGGWKRINSKGEAIGPCAREPGEAKPKCMSNEKRAKLSKKERASAVATKRKHDPNPERKGSPINVSNFGKGKISEDMENLNEKNVPTSPEKWAQAKAQAKAKFDVYPSAYANGWAAKKYKEMGGGWKSVSEAKEIGDEPINDGTPPELRKRGNKTVITSDEIKEAIKDKFDIGEYDQEGDMAKSDLRSIIANAQKMHDMLEDADNLPEWVQSKITKAEDYISTVANYMTAEMNEEIVVEEDIKSARIIKSLYKKKGVMKEEQVEEGMMKSMATDAEETKRLGSWRKETPWMKSKGTVTDKSGAKHTAMSTARDLARKAIQKNVKESVSITESRLADIVREAAEKAKKKKKEETKKSDDTFQPEPELSSQIIRND